MISSSSSDSCSTTASQAWAILRRHARDEISRLRLQELCRDNDRVSSLVSIYNSTAPGFNNMLMVDLSRQRMTLETLNHLLRLGTARGLSKFIRQLSWGPNDPDNPMMRNMNQKENKNQNRDDENNIRSGTKQSSKFCEIPSYHMCLRVPQGQNFEMLGADGSNILKGVHRDWDRIKNISQSLRRGALTGVSGEMIKDVVVVGKGLTIMALRFAYLALCKDEAATVGRRVGMGAATGKGQQRRLKFLTTVDPIRAAAVVADSDPSTTLVVTISTSSSSSTETEPAMVATKTLQAWLLSTLGKHGFRDEVILSKHCMLVTEMDSKAIAASKEMFQYYKADSIFCIPEHSRCEPYLSFTAASLLPLAIVFGWQTVKAFLDGAHDMDVHFVETNPRHNLPVLLALVDIWNDCLLSNLNARRQVHSQIVPTSSAGRIITPYTEALVAYPAFVATLEAYMCKRQKNSEGNNMEMTCSTVVVDGGLHGIYDPSLYEGAKIVPSELMMVLDSQLSLNTGKFETGTAQDVLMCSLFAHADGLALGNDSLDDDGIDGNTTSHGGNRPSTVLLCGRLDAFACGQLVAMAEHRTAVKAWICEMDPFCGIAESGSGGNDAVLLRSRRTKQLQEHFEKMLLSDVDGGYDDEGLNSDADAMNISTKTILRHYANIVKSQRTSSSSSGEA